MAAADEELALIGGVLTADGTALGLIQEVALEPTYRIVPITAEEYGGEMDDALYLGEEWVCTCLLRGVDSDGLAKIFGSATFDYPNAARAMGSLMSSHTVNLVLTPDRSSAPSLPGFRLFKAFPWPEASQRMQFSGYDDFAVLVTWVGIRDVDDKVLDFAS